MAQVVKVDSFSGLYTLESEKKLLGQTPSGHVEIAFNSKGDLYVLDIKNSEVIIYDKNLTKISSFGKKGSENGEFESVSDIYIDKSDRVYITDAYLRRINTYNSEGEFIESFELQNQATDMVKIGDTICTHVGGAMPIDGSTINCYDSQTLGFERSLLPPSPILESIPLGITNVTFNVIQRLDDKIVALNHPLVGEIKIFDKQGELQNDFTIENKIFKQPEIDESYNIYRDQPSDFVDSIIYGIHLIQDKVWVIFVEFGTGDKYLDIYNLLGERLVNEVISLDGSWPIYNDEEGNFYSLSVGEDGESLYLKKYAPK